jgi:hypothetical protein
MYGDYDLVGILVQGEVIPPDQNGMTFSRDTIYRGILNSEQGERVLFEISASPSIIENYNMLFEPGCTLYLKGSTRRSYSCESIPDPAFQVHELVKVEPAGLEEEVNDEYEPQLEEPTLEDQYLGENYTPKPQRRKSTLF